MAIYLKLFLPIAALFQVCCPTLALGEESFPLLQAHALNDGVFWVEHPSLSQDSRLAQTVLSLVKIYV